VLQVSQHIAGQPQVFEELQPALLGEQSQNGLFAKQGGEGTDTGFNTDGGLADAPFLRNVGPVGQQSGENFQPGDNVGGQGDGQLGDALQNAVDSPADDQRTGIWNQVDIGGPVAAGRGEKCIDQLRDVVGGGRGKGFDDSPPHKAPRNRCANRPR